MRLLVAQIPRHSEYKYNNAFGTSSVCVLSYPLSCLAELYLIRAEANIEWNGGDLSVAKADIETIRSRAHMPGLGENLSRDGLRSALRYERMVELCNEGFRWFDIRRWDMAESVISGTLYAPALDGSVSNAVPTIDSDWHVTYNGQTFDGKDMNLRRFITMSYDPMKDALWPIPGGRAHRQSADNPEPRLCRSFNRGITIKTNTP